MEAPSVYKLYGDLADHGTPDEEKRLRKPKVKNRADALSELTNFLSHQPIDIKESSFDGICATTSTLDDLHARTFGSDPKSNIVTTYGISLVARFIWWIIGSDAQAIIVMMVDSRREEFSNLDDGQLVALFCVWAYLQAMERPAPQSSNVQVDQNIHLEENIKVTKNIQIDQNIQITQHIQVIEHAQARRDFAYFMPFATAAYGRALAIHRASVFFQTDEAWIKACTGRKTSRYVATKDLREGGYLLGHYACVDTTQKAVVVAITGTLGYLTARVVMDYGIEAAINALETFIDKDYHPLPTAAEHDIEAAIEADDHPYTIQVSKLSEDGTESGNYDVHRGMWEAAQVLASNTELRDEVQRLLGENPGYKLVLCGHSLGGGVAGLLSILWSDRIQVTGARNTFKCSSIQCYGFGSGASMDDDLRMLSSDMISSVVNSNDIIPALNLGGTQDLNTIFENLKKHSRGTFISLLFSPTRRSILLEQLRSAAKAENHKKLVPPGGIWETGQSWLPHVRAVENVKERFNEGRFVSGMIRDHLTGAYSNSLSGRVYTRAVSFILMIRAAWGIAVKITLWPLQMMIRVMSLFLVISGQLITGWRLLVNIACGVQ